jgi:hypothetical protein
MYLEPIFNSEDIRNSLPVAYREFWNVDSSFRNLMDGCKDDNLVLDCINFDGTTLQ